MANKAISGGPAHKLPLDLRKVLESSREALSTWEDITPLARNEWICWVVSVKTEDTRKKHLERALADLKKGKRRPCCWMGCTHRSGKKPSASQKFVLGRQAKGR